MSATEQGHAFVTVKRDLVRALPEMLEIRAAADGEPGPGTMFGHFAVFNRFTEINSMWEGNFLERIAPGAFKKTFRENSDSIKVLAEHGFDPMIGKRALGSIKVLREDDEGAYYEVQLSEAQDVRDLILPRLREKLYGASFRFSVMREEVVEEPDPTDENPKGLPERTIKEARLFEFGPVTFPAYADATAGARSMTDDFVPAAILARDRAALVERMDADPALAARLRATEAPSEKDPAADEKDPDAAGAGDKNKDAAPERSGSKSRKPATTPLYGLNARKEPWRL